MFLVIFVKHLSGGACGGGGSGLPDGHGAEDVEEDEAAVGHVVPQQVPVAQALREGIRITAYHLVLFSLIPGPSRWG